MLGKLSYLSRVAMLVLVSVSSTAYGEGSSQVSPETVSQKIVTLDKLPLAVREAIARESQGAPTGQIMALPRGGTMVYRFEYVLNGKHESVVLAPDGTVVTREEVEEDD